MIQIDSLQSMDKEGSGLERSWAVNLNRERETWIVTTAQIQTEYFKNEKKPAMVDILTLR